MILLNKDGLFVLLKENTNLNKVGAQTFSDRLFFNFDHQIKQISEPKPVHFEYSTDEINQKQDESIVDAVLLVIDCEKNDRVDIRCGGPEYLGYDFVVEKDKKDEFIKFIRETIHDNYQPLHSIREEFHENIKKMNLWTKTDIQQHIKKSYYPTSSKREYSVGVESLIFTR
jgi:hypothetical protein